MTPLQKEALAALVEGQIDERMFADTYGEHLLESLTLSGYVALDGADVKLTALGAERVKQ